VSVALSEAEVHWRELLQSLQQRGRRSARRSHRRAAAQRTRRHTSRTRPSCRRSD
jgi:hypothetical protein